MLRQEIEQEKPDGSVSCEEQTPAVPLKEKLLKLLKNKKIMIPAIAVVAACLVGVIVFMIVMANKISMKNYLKVTMEGYDGYGRMFFEFADVTFGMRAVGDEEALKFGDRKDEDYFVNYRAEIRRKHTVRIFPEPSVWRIPLRSLTNCRKARKISATPPRTAIVA